LANDSATKLNLFKKPEGIGGETYMYVGKEVIVVEQVRVSSADPSFSCVGQVGGFGGEDSSFKRQGGDFCIGCTEDLLVLDLNHSIS
jgi:hypothetical protein